MLQAIMLAVYWRWRQGTLRRMGSPALAERLLLGFSKPRFWLKNLMTAAALALLAVAIANPRKLIKLPASSVRSADVFIALDVSQSMLARDAAPNRLAQAKNFVQQLVKALEGERVGLIFFAGDAYPQMPLSTDYEAAMLFLRNADTDYITNQGTDISSVIDLAMRSFESNSEAGKALIVVTDGENHDETALRKAGEARDEGLTIFTVGVGTTEGGTIPLGNGVKRDFKGQIVKTQMNPAVLSDLARTGGGSMFTVSGGSAAIAAISDGVDQLQKATLATQAATQWVFYYQWLLLPALLLLVLEQVMLWRKKDDLQKNL